MKKLLYIIFPLIFITCTFNESSQIDNYSYLQKELKNNNLDPYKFKLNDPVELNKLSKKEIDKIISDLKEIQPKVNNLNIAAMTLKTNFIESLTEKMFTKDSFLVNTCLKKIVELDRMKNDLEKQMYYQRYYTIIVDNKQFFQKSDVDDFKIVLEKYNIDISNIVLE